MAKKSGAGHSGLALEVEVGAWEQFERAVDVVVNTGPQHRIHPFA